LSYQTDANVESYTVSRIRPITFHKSMVIFKHNARENKHDYYNTVAPTNKKRAYSANKLE